MFVFISDVHLQDSPVNHPLKRQLERVLQNHDISAIFLLGDIFEFWWGDDHLDKNYTDWEDFFKSLKCEKYLLHGNRDFLLGSHFCQKTEITLLPPGTIIRQGSKNIALFHGDEEALIDRKYHIFKSMIRSPLLKKIWFYIPESTRKNISSKGRSLSQAPPILDYNYDIWLDKLPDNITHIIHGHCHREGSKDYKNVKIITLGHWYNDESSLYFMDRSGQEMFLDL